MIDASVGTSYMAAERTPLRIGVVSTASIASKNFLAISEARGAVVTAISSRTLSKAQAWSDARGGGLKCYGSHAEMFADADVDAVYIPAPTGVRQPLVLAAAAAGKSVVAEKPIAPTTAEAQAEIDACKAAGGASVLRERIRAHNAVTHPSRRSLSPCRRQSSLWTV